MNIDFLFPEFVYTNLIDIDCKKIQNYSYELMEKNKGVQKSNRGGWQSMDLFDENIFFTSIKKDLKYFKEALQIFDMNFYLDNFWFNINRKNNFNVIHEHLGHFISGVLYVKCPDNCGNIVFTDSSAQIRDSYMYNLGLIGKLPKNNVFLRQWQYTPKEGLLLMFPSWLEHYVEPNESDEDRISIAFNIGVK
jgi:uncharacterized protein (TIGR02466 family)